jgi:hypothetical protein
MVKNIIITLLVGIILTQYACAWVVDTTPIMDVLNLIDYKVSKILSIVEHKPGRKGMS